MKRTRRWLLIFAALIGLMAHAGALKATSLLFGKTSTTTTTTTSTTQEPSADEISITEAPVDNNTATKSTLTGIPQIDYVWDPNLPRELNGYNLSEYPFFSSVPPNEEIDFKCAGLHDGFYASVQHKCQLYHHCVYGVRYDFLCSNFTAFDQKTFICHFASEVDCKNSPKYFHRNDALYKATTTTSTTTTTTPAPITTPSVGRRPGRPNRRPLRRRRPQVDYYYYDEDYDDEYYEERANRRRQQRPRTRRPVYEDEYEETEPRFDKRPYNDRAIIDEDDGYVRSKSDKPRIRNRPGETRRFNDDERVERRRSGNGDRRRPIDDRRPSFRSPGDEPKIDDNEERRPINGRRRYNNGERRPIFIDHDKPIRRDQEEPDEEIIEERKEEKLEAKPLVKPSSGGSLFARPRAPPKISRPVPINEKKKFEYKTTTTVRPPPIEDDYYDDYEDDVPARIPVKEEKVEKTPVSSSQSSQRDLRRPVPIKKDANTRYETVRDIQPLDDDYDDRPIEKTRFKAVDRDNRRGILRREEPLEDDEIDVRSRSRSSERQSYRSGSDAERDNNRETNRDSITYKEKGRRPYREDSYDEEPIREARPLVRVVKRPFLPSRGGSPHLPRGLQAVGAAQKQPATESTAIDMGSTVSGVRLLEHAAPIVRDSASDDDYPSQHKGPRTTQQPQVESPKTSLDEIYDNEYDVTLNDALNPTIKPLAPSRGISRRFSHSSKFDRNEFLSLGKGYSLADDSYYSSTDVRSSAVERPSRSRTTSSRGSHLYYDDYNY